MVKRGEALELTSDMLAQPTGPYNPLDRTNLARSLELELLSREATPLAEPGPVRGSGIYAIYYAGQLEIYRPTTNVPPNFRRPIYVGKAIPKGRRTGAAGPEQVEGQCAQREAP